MKTQKNELVFCCIPETKNINCKTQFTKSDLEKFDNDIDFFIKDRIKKNKLIKFKVPNGVYGIYKIKYITFNYENLRGIAEPYELLGHLIKKFNPKEGTIGHEQEKLERLFKNGTLSKYQFSRARMRSWEGDTLSGEIYSLKRNNFTPKYSYFIGDTNIDFLAAKRAKMNFIFAKYGYGKNNKLYKNKISNFKEIKKYIKK